MFIAIWVFNNITVHRLLIVCRKILLDQYNYQITNDFEKLLNLENMEIISMIIASIVLVFYIYIVLTRFLENGAFNTKFDADKKLHIESTGLD